VSTLNQTKASLLTRLRGDRGQRGTRRTLHYYFAAQDIHERASSSHIQYQTLREHFRYSDVMFRFQRLITLQSQACSRLAHAILLRTPYQHDHRFERAFIHLDAALDRIRASGTTSSDQLKALGFYSIISAPSTHNWRVSSPDNRKRAEKRNGKLTGR
jgi:uncharacterized membrane protein YccC